MSNLYTQLKNAGCKLNSHESDLYVERTKKALKIIKAYNKAGGCALYSSFKNHIDGKEWLDIPFMYSPWWNKRGMN